MSKKLYHLPLQQLHLFIDQHKSTLRSNMKNSKKLEYAKRFGKACYLLEIERFICFLKIDSNLDHALKLISYFESEAFIKELLRVMELEKLCEAKREHFYLFLHYLQEHETQLFSTFLQQSFMHYHTAQTPSSKTDAQTLATTLAKDKNIDFSESFGEENGQGYVKILLDGEVVVERKGKSIKKLRKLAYGAFLKLL